MAYVLTNGHTYITKSRMANSQQHTIQAWPRSMMQKAKPGTY